MSFNFSPKIVTDGLILYLDAANTKSYVSGSTIWNDLSTNMYTSTLTNMSGSFFNQNNLGGLVFDGTNDYATFGNSGGLAVRQSSAMTIMSSFICTSTSNPVGGSSWAPIITLDNNAPNRKFTQHISKSTTTNTESILSFYSTGSVNSTIQYTASTITNPILNKNFIVTSTIDNTSHKLYINGTLENQTTGLTLNTSLLSTTPLVVGARITTGYQGYFGGTIYSTLIYNRVLTSNEVLQNYNALKNRYGL